MDTSLFYDSQITLPEVSEDSPTTQEEFSQLVYRISDNGPQLLKSVLDNRGWIQYVEGKEPLYWNLSWKGYYVCN